MAELAQGEKVCVVYDSLGKSTWQGSLNILKRHGLMVNCGNTCGPVAGVDLALLNQQESLYVSRPSLNGYITNRAELQCAKKSYFRCSAAAPSNSKLKSSKNLCWPMRSAHQALKYHSASGSNLLIP